VLSGAQDAANWLANGFGAATNDYAGATEFVFFDATGSQDFWSTVVDVSSNKALITIPWGWAPYVYIPYGGAVATNDISTILDQTGVKTWDQQLTLLLNLAPLVGFVLGYGLGEGTQPVHDAQNWIRQTFSQQPS
jgi:hypothetical protein